MTIPTVVSTHYNTENEMLTIEKATTPEFEGQYLLVIHDDPYPVGTGAKALMLLDEGTRQFLLVKLAELGSL